MRGALSLDLKVIASGCKVLARRTLLRLDCAGLAPLARMIDATDDLPMHHSARFALMCRMCEVGEKTYHLHAFLLASLLSLAPMSHFGA